MPKQSSPATAEGLHVKSVSAVSGPAITGSYNAMALIGITIDAVEKLSGSATSNQTEIENIARTLKLVQMIVQARHDALELDQGNETNTSVDQTRTARYWTR